MTIELAVLNTLCYHDLFDYPLTQSEISKFLIRNSKLTRRRADREIQSLIKKKVVQKKNGFYFLAGRGEIMTIRRRRQKISQKKLANAQSISRWLRRLPTIKLIAITGAVAIGNAKENDDLDFLIITAANRLWLTRFFVLLLTEFLGKRRRPTDINVRDKACLNVLLDENYLTLPQSKRNLFTAHEICQMQVLNQKDNFHQRFLDANPWLVKFLPNWKK